MYIQKRNIQIVSIVIQLKLYNSGQIFKILIQYRLLLITARRSNQSLLKEISPGCSLEGLMLKLKLQYFDSFEKTLMLGKIEGRRDDRG